MNRRNVFKALTATALATAVASAWAGDITLFDSPNFQGRSIAVVGNSVPNLQDSILSHPASSLVVADGTWEACSAAYFQGHCERFMPGSYGALNAGFNGMIASVRQIAYTAPTAQIVNTPSASAPIVINPGQSAVVVNSAPPTIVSTPVVVPSTAVVTLPPSAVVTAPAVTIPQETRIVLYENNARGTQALELTSDSLNLDDQRFGNRANGALVVGGVWRLCDQWRGRGHCTDFGPGRYDSLGSLNYKVSSAYLVASEPSRITTTTVIPGGVVPQGRLVLYQYPNFGGPSAVVELGSSPDLNWAHFIDRAESMRVESGRWQVCSNRAYEGECRVYGPGEYPYLSDIRGGGVYSARQVWGPTYGYIDRYSYYARGLPDPNQK